MARPRRGHGYLKSGRLWRYVIEFWLLMIETWAMTRAMLSFLLVSSLTLWAAGCGDNMTTEPDAVHDALVDALAEPDAHENPCHLKPDGTPCGDQTESDCDHANMCVSGYCYANFEIAGRQCGDASDNECDRADTCDGSGVCSPNYVLEGTLCGDPTDTICTDPDTCDGAETCLANSEPDGLSCIDCSGGLDLCVCLSGLCANNCTAPGTLLTTFTGTAVEAGTMFDIRALNTVEIQGFDTNLEPGIHTMEIYYRPGPYLGHETNVSSWNLLAIVSVMSNGAGVPTRIPFDLQLVIPAGETYAFHITATTPVMFSTEGTEAGTVYASDSNVELLQGIANAYPFGMVFTPRVFNGTVHYGVCDLMSMPDAGVPDAAVPDAAVPDAEVPDAEVPDAEVPDAEVPDSGAPDGSTSDASPSDALVDSAPPPDSSGLPDAITLD
jgi:hypothetical protein